MSDVWTIEEFEQYPTYRLGTDGLEWGAARAAVDAETLARWQRVIDEYWQVQGEMAAVYERDEEAKKVRRGGLTRLLEAGRFTKVASNTGMQAWRAAIERHRAP